MLRRFCTLCGGEFVAQLRLQRHLVCFDKSVEPDAAAAVGERHDRSVAHGGVLPDQIDKHRRVVDQPPAAAFAVGEIKQATRDGLIDFLSGDEPDARDERFAREDLALLQRQRFRRVAALMLQHMPEIFVSGDTEQAAARLETRGQLKVRDIGPAVAAAQPVLLFRQIVVADAGAMQPVQRLSCGTEIGDVTARLCQMQGYAVDEAAHQRPPAAPQQLWPDVEIARQRQRAALPREQMARQQIRPPRHFIEASQHGIDFTRVATKPAALDGRKYVALEQHAVGPACREVCGVVLWQAHGTLTRPPQRADGRRSSGRDRPAPGRSSPASSRPSFRCRAAATRPASWSARSQAAGTVQS